MFKEAVCVVMQHVEPRLLINVVNVIDAIMGAGKSTAIIKKMNKSHRQRMRADFDNKPENKINYLVVVPLLSEVDRYMTACKVLDFSAPRASSKGKIADLRALIEQGENICTTHALFAFMTTEIHQLLNDRRYVLVLDEVISCVNLADTVSESDLKILLKTSMEVDPTTNRVCWKEYPYAGKFNEVKGLCENSKLVYYRKETLLWEFPLEFLQCFEEVYILTYLFDASPMAAHIKSGGLGVNRMTTDKKGNIVAAGKGQDESAKKRELRKLITIYEGESNRIGTRQGKENPLSSMWFQNQERQALDKLKASTEYFFKSVAKSPSTCNGWTTFKKQRSKLSGDRYSRGFIPMNAKATNEHKAKRSMAYLCNVFYHPMIKGYLTDKGIKVDEDLYALSEMLQWIWRSQIREGKPINLFIPSERMRNLFKDWLNETGKFAVKKPALELAA